jgi:hypothetical protein
MPAVLLLAMRKFCTSEGLSSTIGPNHHRCRRALSVDGLPLGERADGRQQHPRNRTTFLHRSKFTTLRANNSRERV